MAPPVLAGGFFPLDPVALRIGLEQAEQTPINEGFKEVIQTIAYCFGGWFG